MTRIWKRKRGESGRVLRGGSWVLVGGGLRASGHNWRSRAPLLEAKVKSIWKRQTGGPICTFRGGSWNYSDKNLRASYHYWVEYDGNLGLRCWRLRDRFGNLSPAGRSASIGADVRTTASGSSGRRTATSSTPTSGASASGSVAEGEIERVGMRGKIEKVLRDLGIDYEVRGDGEREYLVVDTDSLTPEQEEALMEELE